MPKRTNQFQQLVHLIEYQLTADEATVTESKEFTDQVTGQQREVDIVIEAKVGTHPLIIGIKCADRARPMDVTWIEGIHNKHQDLGSISRTITVSRSGYTKAALEKAKQRKIDALTLTEAKKSNWVKYTNRLSTLKELTVQSPSFRIKDVSIRVMTNESSISGGGGDTMLYDKAGTPLLSLGQIVENVVNTDPNFIAHIDQLAVPDAEVTFSIMISALDVDYYVFDSAGTKHRLAHILLTGECWLEVSTIPLDRASYEATSVLHGTGELMGQPVQVAWTEEEDGRMILGVSIGGPDTSNSEQSRQPKQKPR